MKDNNLILLFNLYTDSIEYQDYGILPMEAFCLYQYCIDYQITMLIESGTANGYSTEMMGNLLEDVKIYTIDKCSTYGEGVQDKTEQRLSYLSNIICLKGDSFVYLPKLVQDHPKEKIGIFIDGPKYKEGTQLALESLRRSNVVFSACHDIMFQEENTYCPNLDEDYIKEYSFLNKTVNGRFLDHDKYEGKTIGEYFPKGMGITFFHKNYGGKGPKVYDE